MIRWTDPQTFVRMHSTPDEYAAAIDLLPDDVSAIDVRQDPLLDSGVVERLDAWAAERADDWRFDHEFDGRRDRTIRRMALERQEADRRDRKIIERKRAARIRARARALSKKLDKEDPNMPCTTLYDADGNAIAVTCSRGDRRKPCSTANCTGRATKLCDYPLAKGGTCDRPVCARCATSVGPDKDYCPPHARHAAKQQELPLGGGR